MSTSGAVKNQAFNFNFSFVDSANPDQFYTTALANTDITIRHRNGAVMSSYGNPLSGSSVTGSVHSFSLVAAEMNADEIILECTKSGMVSENIAIITEATQAEVVTKTGFSIAGTKTTLDALNDIAATDIVSSGPIVTSAGAVVNVDSVDVCTTNSDMRGTDGANTTTPPTVAAIADGVWDEATAGHNIAGTFGENLDDSISNVILDIAGLNDFDPATQEVLANVKKISDDATAADNMELMYDGTGLVGENFPSYQAQLSQIAVTGSAVNSTYDNWTNTTANVVAGTADSTLARDGQYYQLEDVGGVLSVDIEFQVGSDGVPTGFTFYGYLTSGNDDVQIQAYNWSTSSFQKVGDVVGRNSASVQEINIPLFISNVGTGADEGRVIIRLFDNSLTSADLYIDQAYVSYAVVNRSVGYALGAVWNDDGSSNTGTTAFIDGTADNRTNSYANAIAIANSVNLYNYQWTKDDAVTLTQSHAGDRFEGFKYLLNMNNQQAPTTTVGGICFGIDNSNETHFFKECALGDLQNGNGSLEVKADIIGQGCVVEDLELPAVAAASGINVQLSGCVGLETGTFAGGGYIDFGNLAGTNHRLVASDWGGSIELRNMRAGDFASIAGTGTITLAASCTGGTFIPAGVLNVIDNSATVTIIRDGLTTKSEITDSVWDEAQSGHTTVGSFGYYLDAQVSAAGGGGSSDWTTTEKNQIRYRLGVDGTTAVPVATPDLSTFDAATDTVTTDTASRNASKADVSALATQASVDVIDANVDAILVDTGTTLPASIATVDSNVDAILVDTGTTLPSTLSTIESKVDVVDTNVDAILVDTGTTIPAQISGLNDIAATDIVTAGPITTLAGAVVNVDTVDTVTTNTDMLTVSAIADGVWDEATSGHTTAGTTGKALSDVLTYNANFAANGIDLTATQEADLVDATWDELQSGHTIPGTFGYNLDAQISGISGGGGGTDWSSTERDQIRYRLGIDGAVLAPSVNAPDLAQESDLSTLATAAALATVDGNVDAIKVKTDQLTFTVANQVDSNALTGGGGDDAATIYSYFTAGSNEDAFKADVSSLATQASVNTIDTEVGQIKAKTDQLSFTVANQVDANALTGGGGDDSATIYSYFTAGSREDAFKADVSNLATSAEITALNDPTAGAIADAVWDELQFAHTTPGSFGSYIDSNLNDIRTVVDGISTDVTTGFSDIATDGVILTPAQESSLVDDILNEPLAGHATAGSLGKAISDIETDVTSILGDTSTDGVVISAVQAQAIADEVLSRSVANVEATAAEHTLATIVLAMLESERGGTTWTIRKTGGTPHVVKSLVLDQNALPVIEVD